jgi:hypothetical protein
LKRHRPRLTYANVIATLALFVALGGVSYAATQLPANSVGSKQLKKGAVTPVKLSGAARETLTGPLGQKGEPGPRGEAGPATGAAGGALTGSYPDPSLAPGAVTPAAIGTIPAAALRQGCPNAYLPGGTLHCHTLTIGSGTEVTLCWLAEEIDHGGASGEQACGEANGRGLVAPVEGTYLISGRMDWQASSTGTRLARLKKNGTVIAADHVAAAGSGDTIQGVTTIATLAAGESVTLGVEQDSGTAVSIASPAANPADGLEMSWIGPAS